MISFITIITFKKFVFKSNSSMMEFSANFLPKNDELKKKLRIPLSFAISPASSESFFQIKCLQPNLYTCSKCHSFISPNCVTNGAMWKCGICGTQNQGNNDDFFKTLKTSNSIEILYNSTKQIGQIFAIYISLEFQPLDFIKAKISAFSILRHLPKDAKCIIIIGTDSSEFSILAPPSSKLDIPEDSLQRAAIVRFQSIQSLAGLDLTRFFFTSDNSNSAESTIDRLTYSTNSNPFQKSINFAKILSNIINPIHFISIINEVTRSAIDFDPIIHSMIRIDFIVAKMNSRAIEISKQIPGAVNVLSKLNPALQSQLIVQQKTKYQIIVTCLSNGSDVKWQKPIRPYTDIAENSIFAPVSIGDDNPYVIDITPNNKSEIIHFQFVSKFSYVEKNEKKSVARIQNFSVKTTDDFDTYLSSVNWNNVLWFWSRKVVGMQHDEAVAALMRVATIVVQQIGGINNSNNETVSIDDFNPKIDRDFLRGICSIYLSNAFSNVEEDFLEGTNLLLFTPPSKLKIIPKITETEGNKICQSINGVSESRGTAKIISKFARKLQMELPIFVPIRTPVERDFGKISNQYLTILKNLIDRLS